MVSAARPPVSDRYGMGETILQHHGAGDGDIAGRPLAGPEQTLLGGVHLAPVGERAGL
jgi:hypothetical protein